MYTVGEKVIVCGRSVRWWDDKIKAKMEQWHQLYKRMVRGQEGLLRREVKHFVMQRQMLILKLIRRNFARLDEG